MLNRWILFICFGILLLFVASCSYASNETDILNDTVDTVSINVTSVDLESDNYDNDSFDDVNSHIDNISIYYGELIDIGADFEESCNCTVYIDNKPVNFIDLRSDMTINMYNYYEDFLNSIYPNIGLHNMSIIFEFDTPQKYDVTMETYKDDYEGYGHIYNVLLFYFNVNDDVKAKKRYSYNTTLNILKKDKTVHISNISSFASYTNPLIYDVIVDNLENSTVVFVSNKTDIISFDTSYGGMGQYYSFDLLRHKIKPGVYNFTVVNAYDNTFDTVSFTLCNDISINTSYKIENNNVILNVELSCEYSTPIHVFMSKFINETEYDYRTVTKEILTKANKHKFNFEICFNDVDNNEYGIYIYDYYIIIDCFHLTVNYTHVNETGICEGICDVNETVNVSDIVKSNVSGIYNGSNVDGNSNNGTDNNSDLNENSNDSNSHKSHKSDVDDFRKVISSFGDLISSADSTSSEEANSYELIRKSALKSSNNIFSNFIIMILLFIAFMVGFLMFKREY